MDWNKYVEARPWLQDCVLVEWPLFQQVHEKASGPDLFIPNPPNSIIPGLKLMKQSEINAQVRLQMEKSRIQARVTHEKQRRLLIEANYFASPSMRSYNRTGPGCIDCKHGEKLNQVICRLHANAQVGHYSKCDRLEVE